MEPKNELFSCTNCGAELKYLPGTTHLNCDYCGESCDIPQLDTQIKELDFNEFLANEAPTTETITESFVDCSNCGASSTLEPHVTSALCPYCSTPLVVNSAHDETIIQPKSLLPFKFGKEQAKDELKGWISKLWFAPNNLKKAVLNFDHFKGIYIPYWTFDTDTLTDYVGQRGEYYYQTETYTTMEDGKPVTKTRRVRKTRWYPANGRVQCYFDDILTAATTSLPKKYIYKLEPWDLENLIPFDKNYLSGFISEKYQIELAQGFEIAKTIAAPDIKKTINRDIGGDLQRIINSQTDYKDITFKHILLPVFVSAYQFKGKNYQFLINGRTGEVQAERPYSVVKIISAILIALLIIICIILGYNYFANN